MAALLMAIFAWFASLVTAADSSRSHATAKPTAAVAKASAPVNTPLPTSFAFETLPVPDQVEIKQPELCNAIFRAQDGRATMSDALSGLKTCRVSSATSGEYRIIIQGARFRVPPPPPPSWSAGNS